MNTINDRIVEVSLSKKFYFKEQLFQAAKDFSDVCNCKIEDSNGRFNIILEEKADDDINIIGHEFCNYVLSLMKGEGIV